MSETSSFLMGHVTPASGPVSPFVAWRGFLPARAEEPAKAKVLPLRVRLTYWVTGSDQAHTADGMTMGEAVAMSLGMYFERDDVKRCAVEWVRP